ncbi:MAG: hypothetical protein AAF703_06960 [Cyanobacteria bacterium P01_D01_bin.105]
MPSKHRTHLLSAAIIAVLPTLLIACNSPASQCRQVADTIRQAQSARETFATDIEAAQIKVSGAQTIEDVKAAATDYIAAVRSVNQGLEKTLQALGNINTEDPQLNEYRESYIITLNGSKTALATAGDAMKLVLEAKDEDALRSVFATHQTKSDRAYGDILAQDAKEAALIDQINAYCSQTP